MIVHFVGFRDDRYWNAVKIFGSPHYIHRGWDMRARRELSASDVVVFAEGPHDQQPRVKSFHDLNEESPPPGQQAAGSW